MPVEAECLVVVVFVFYCLCEPIEGNRGLGTDRVGVMLTGRTAVDAQ